MFLLLSQDCPNIQLFGHNKHHSTLILSVLFRKRKGACLSRGDFYSQLAEVVTLWAPQKSSRSHAERVVPES